MLPTNTGKFSIGDGQVDGPTQTFDRLFWVSVF
jgi:hypothetical protein